MKTTTAGCLTSCAVYGFKFCHFFSSSLALESVRCLYPADSGTIQNEKEVVGDSLCVCARVRACVCVCVCVWCVCVRER